MKKRMLVCLLLALLMPLQIFAGGAEPVLPPANGGDVLPTVAPLLAPEAKSAVLMEASTGTVLYEQNADERRPPASVTKIMTLLLVMEAIDDGKIKMDEPVTVSEVAAKMGGSQVYLEPGEQMTVHDLLKCVAVASANDAAVALAEHLAGSMEGFVSKMNERAEALGMTGSHFENPTGLDDDVIDHMTTARDIGIMSCELMKHEKIEEFTTIWMDSVRNGQFGLTNTNRLVRFYPGCNGLKTGYTAKAKYCISATAKRNGMQLVAVIMGADTRDSRNQAAKQLLDYGFANYSLFEEVDQSLSRLPVLGGEKGECALQVAPFRVLLGKGEESRVEKSTSLPENLPAPIIEGDKVGEVVYSLNGKTIGSVDIVATEAVEHIRYGSQLMRLLRGGLLL